MISRGRPANRPAGRQSDHRRSGPQFHAELLGQSVSQPALIYRGLNVYKGTRFSPTGPPPMRLIRDSACGAHTYQGCLNSTMTVEGYKKAIKCRSVSSIHHLLRQRGPLSLASLMIQCGPSWLSCLSDLDVGADGRRGARAALNFCAILSSVRPSGVGRRRDAGRAS